MIIVIFGCVTAGLFIINRWDEPLPLKGREYCVILIGAFLQGTVIRYLSNGEPAENEILLAVIGGSLLLACVTDIIICQVYNFTWLPAVTAASILFWYRLCGMGIDAICHMLWSLFFFLFAQRILFFKMYGKADGYAFCVCALAEAARGIKTAGFLLHMLLAYVLLFLVQAVRSNINSRGNLKQPVPFLPYITISFWMTVCLWQMRNALLPFCEMSSRFPS